jgi:hypothetical protein
MHVICWLFLTSDFVGVEGLAQNWLTAELQLGNLNLPEKALASGAEVYNNTHYEFSNFSF